MNVSIFWAGDGGVLLAVGGAAAAFVGGFGRSLSIWTPEPYLDFNLIKEGENAYHFKC